MAEIAADLAYAAAEARLHRTTSALVLAEAELLSVRQDFRRREAEWEHERERLLRAEENHWRPTNEGPPEWVCPMRADAPGWGEVSTHAADYEGAAPHGEADSTPGFSD